MTPQLYRVTQFCESHGISRSTFYREVRAGRLHIIKLGPNSTGVLTEEARRWLQDKALTPVSTPNQNVDCHGTSRHAMKKAK